MPSAPELVDARLELDPAGSVDQVQERHLALAAARRQPTGDPVRDVGLVARRQVGVRGPDRRHRLDPVELVRERVDAGRPQRLELLAAGGEDVCRLLAIGAHRARDYFVPTSILVIFSLRSPRGVEKTTSSPRL